MARAFERHSANEALVVPVIRFTRFLVSPLGHYMEAALWPQVRRPDVVGVISHQSALAVHGLSDVNPAKIHMTLPSTIRLRREIPRVLAIHYADLDAADIVRVQCVPVTTPARTIRDAHESHSATRSLPKPSPTAGAPGAYRWRTPTNWRVNSSVRSRANAESQPVEWGDGRAPASAAGQRRGQRRVCGCLQGPALDQWKRLVAEHKVQGVKVRNGDAWSEAFDQVEPVDASKQNE